MLLTLRGFSNILKKSSVIHLKGISYEIYKSGITHLRGICDGLKKNLVSYFCVGLATDYKMQILRFEMDQRHNNVINFGR